MKDYSCTEIGMLLGAAVGGAFSILFFSLTGNVLFFALTAAGIAAGVATGSMLDRNRKNDNQCEDTVKQKWLQ